MSIENYKSIILTTLIVLASSFHIQKIQDVVQLERRPIFLREKKRKNKIFSFKASSLRKSSSKILLPHEGYLA